MIESMMYFGAGFLFATLIGVTVIPLVHGRAVRLTIRRLEDSIPQSMAEIQADKDALRAEFAMSTRRLEMSVEQLQNKSANQLAELGRKGDAINRLKVERETQKVEVLALKTEVNSLKEGLTAAPEEAEAAEDLRHERNVVTLVPSTAEPVPMPAAFLQGPPLDGQPHEDDLISIPGELPKAEEARSGNTARDPYAGRDSYEQRIGMALERSDFLLRGAEPSIHVSRRTPGYQSMGDKPPIGRRISRDLTRFSVAALIGVGAIFAWQSQNDEAREAISTWASSLAWLVPVSTAKLLSDVAAEQSGATPPGQSSAQDAAAAQSAPVSQTPAAPATATSPELVNQPEEAVQHDLASRPQGVEPSAAEPEEATQNIATPNAVEKEVPLPAQQTSEKLTPPPVTRPTVIADWSLREVIDGTAVLQGPNGILSVTRGDTVPGLGRVDSIVRWGNRWIVATSVGYCKSDLPNQPAEDGTCKSYRGY